MQLTNSIPRKGISKTLLDNAHYSLEISLLSEISRRIIINY